MAPAAQHRPEPRVTERQRIARDLHDQAGSQLVHAMALVDGGSPAMRAAAAGAEHCSLDLRLLVDSMDGDDDALSGPSGTPAPPHPAGAGPPRHRA